MANFGVLADALAYIELNLCSPLDAEGIAQTVHVSLSSVQKLFRRALQVSVKTYIDRRRLTLAARDLQEGKLSVIEIAMKYQYNSPEVFSRAFCRLWGAPPTVYRRQWRFAGLYPRREIDAEGERFMASKRVDLGELYDELLKKRGSYVLCFDICGLMAINQISRALGDVAILAGLERIERAASDDMLLFRVGGDEFALVTGLMDAEAVRAVGERVIAENGDQIQCQEHRQPLSIWASAVRLDAGRLRYAELFEKLHRACLAGKTDAGRVMFLEA